MKKVSILALLPLLAIANMEITIQESVSQILKPDVLRGSFTFEEHSSKIDPIKTHLNTIIAEVKKFDPNGKICRGGGYHLAPMYSYKDQKQEFIGYSANLGFNCEFSSIEQYNSLNASIDKVITPATKRSLGSLSWGVSDTLQERTKQSLRHTMITKTLQQASEFTTSTKMQCRVGSINFGGTHSPVPMRLQKGMMLDMVAASAPTESPIESNEENRLDATVTYTCQ